MRRVTLQPDSGEYDLLTLPDADVVVRLAQQLGRPVEIEVLGNRQGILSLANALLWLYANAFRREFMSLTGLPFVRKAEVALVVRVLEQDNDDPGHGWLQQLDVGVQFEWQLPEDDLVRLALLLHRLGCCPEHGYDMVPVGEANRRRTDATVRVELFSNRACWDPAYRAEGAP